MGDAHYNFGPARQGEDIVFGASRPGYPGKKNCMRAVPDWIEHMKSRKILRVCCLLEGEKLLQYYNGDLMFAYEKAFGAAHIRWVPMDDYRLCSREALHGQVMPFLSDSAQSGERVVVHCSAGQGRTGLVLMAWLMSARKLGYDAARIAVNVRGTIRKRSTRSDSPHPRPPQRLGRRDQAVWRHHRFSRRHDQQCGDCLQEMEQTVYSPATGQTSEKCSSPPVGSTDQGGRADHHRRDLRLHLRP